ncbi:MAG: phage tail sheath family protein [Phormidesmis priestleyi]|uniref:Phage tail sheath family protein n=1 Tax=Phormidesmis priestleyi TaxID=268141 RepID=A0A2W4X9G6_9CYAN|nr:MAG: phage tail sheath family protein [Phormidesmis priestleyi]
MPAKSLGLVPGVYREDIFPTPSPALPTGVPIFLGFAAKGRENDPQRLTLWPQFAEAFGESLSGGYLAAAVRGFFSNGGDFCYVLRLTAQGSAEDVLQAGLAVIAPLSNIDLVCVPDIMKGHRLNHDQVWRLQQQVIEHCDQLGDRFAILDALPSVELTSDQAKNDLQQQLANLTGDNAALYAPWLQNDRRDWVPPCGHVAGVYAKRDRTIGVHHAPANEVLEDVLDISVRFSNADQSALNAAGNGQGNQVNCVRSLPGRGIRIWGAYTLSANPLWRYVGVRRLFITVGRWAEHNLSAAAFEPNNVTLWIRIERELTAYLEALAQQGALQGETPEQAFFVKCDAETNPSEVRDQGQVVTEIGLAPTLLNEFIVVRLIHGASGVVVNSAPVVPP